MKSLFVILITVALIEFTLSAKITPANGSKNAGSVVTPQQSTEADVDTDYSDEQTDEDDSNERDGPVKETPVEPSKVAAPSAKPTIKTPENVAQKTSANVTPEHTPQKTPANTTQEKASQKPSTNATPKKPVGQAAKPKTGHAKTVPATKPEKADDDDETVAVPRPGEKRKSSARPSRGENARPPRKNSASRTKSSPKVDGRTFDLSELASSWQSLPPHVVRSAKYQLAGLQHTFDDFPAIQSYFARLSSSLGSNDYVEHVPETGYGYASPSYLGWATPASAMFTEFGGLGIQAGGDATRMAGRVADSFFQNMKDGNELVKKNTGFVRRVPILRHAVDPVNDMVDAGLDVGHSMFGSNAGTVGAQISEIGQHLRKKGVDRRLSRSRQAKPQSDSPLTY